MLGHTVLGSPAGALRRRISAAHCSPCYSGWQLPAAAAQQWWLHRRSLRVSSHSSTPQAAAGQEADHHEHAQNVLTRQHAQLEAQLLPDSKSQSHAGGQDTITGQAVLTAQQDAHSAQVIQLLVKQQAQLVKQVARQAAVISDMQAQQAQQAQQMQAALLSQALSAQSAPQEQLTPFQRQALAGIGDRRLQGKYDARYHSTAGGATPKDFRVLPDRIFLVRHAESEGNADSETYSHTPDSRVPLTELGARQALAAGAKMRAYLDKHNTKGKDYKLFFYTSPYQRSLETYEYISCAFTGEHTVGVQEEVQLREQDFGNFQSTAGKVHEKADRLRFGRFYYRFPNGESGADVYDRVTIFEDHMIRDINAGRFPDGTNLVLVTHGLALRIFLMRWFHWTVEQYLQVFNPPNAEPLILERVPDDWSARTNGSNAWVHTKALYRLTDESRLMLKGCTDDMSSTGHHPRAPSVACQLVAAQGGITASGDKLT